MYKQTKFAECLFETGENRKVCHVHVIRDITCVRFIYFRELLEERLKMNNEIENKLEDIKLILDKDLSAADVQVSIFVSAAISFKQDSLLTPFPKNYVDGNGVKNFEKLVN